MKSRTIVAASLAVTLAAAGWGVGNLQAQQPGFNCRLDRRRHRRRASARRR